MHGMLVDSALMEVISEDGSPAGAKVMPCTHACAIYMCNGFITRARQVQAATVHAWCTQHMACKCLQCGTIHVFMHVTIICHAGVCNVESPCDDRGTANYISAA